MYIYLFKIPFPEIQETEALIAEIDELLAGNQPPTAAVKHGGIGPARHGGAEWKPLWLQSTNCAY